MSNYYEKFLDPYYTPAREDVTRFIFDSLSLPYDECAADHYRHGKEIILTYLESIGAGYNSQDIESLFDDWFQLPIHAIIPLLLDIICELLTIDSIQDLL